jgi:uncharacterized protein with NRDE domain
VVLSALSRPSLDGAVALVTALDATSYNPFNLLLGDARRLLVAYARPESRAVELHHLPPGIYALPNDRLDSPEFPKAGRAVELSRSLVSLSWEELVPRAQEILADHELPAVFSDGPAPPGVLAGERRKLQALCVHTPIYGTRSSTLLAISAAAIEHYLHAEGPPCQKRLLPQVELLARLRARV